MKEHPIIFSTAMVQAILEGRKTQTRRIVKPQPDDDGLWDHSALPMSLESKLEGWHGSVYNTGESRFYKCQYGNSGDTLWVRESFHECKPSGQFPDITKSLFNYKADHPNRNRGPIWTPFDKWSPSIHMKRIAARIFLKVENVSVKRIQDITGDEILKEGVGSEFRSGARSMTSCAIDHRGWEGNQKYKFKALWDSINGKRASWESNPWVWVIEFSKMDKA